MPGAATPPILPQPIASGAGGGFITNPMPPTPPGSPPEAASIELGFPPVTMQPELSGGLPPDGQDMNGFLFLISSHTMYVQCGQLYQYNATLAADIGGYLAGTVLGMLDGTGMWLNLTNGNSTNPDTGGAGWVPLTAYGFTTVTGLTGGTVALTAAESKYSVIILEGSLTSNLFIQLPEHVQQWLIVNNTSGAFVTTVLTAAGGSTGVVVPQGGFTAPTGVYSIDDGNIYPTVAPLSVPISQAATPLTLIERTSAGYAFAVYFNQSSALENPTIGAVFVQNSAADGYLRKISLANFISQLAPPLFTSPALTGTPTAPTQAPGTNNTEIATTAFVTAAVNAGGNAGGGGSSQSSWWRKNPDGTIEQGGSYAYGGVVSTQIVPFVVPFTTKVLQVIQGSSVGGFTPGWPAGNPSNSLSQFVAQFNGMGGTSQTCYWRAVGV